MKKILIAFSFLGCVASVFAQSDSIVKSLLLQEKQQKAVLATANRLNFRSATTKTKLDSLVSTDTKEATKEVYTYNANGLVSMAVSYLKEAGVWTLSEKTAYFYDSNNRLNGYTMQEWDATNKEWTNSFKDTIVFNTAGKISYSEGFSWSSTSSAWTAFNKVVDTYDANNQLVADTSYSISSNLTSYSMTKAYGYSNGLLVSKTEYLWISGAWANYQKTEYYYLDSQLDSAYIYAWSNSAWTEYEKETYSYDASGNLLEYLFYDLENSAWTCNYKCDQTYDTSVSVSDIYIEDINTIIYTKTSDIAYNSELLQSISYDGSIGNWTQSSADTYYYSPSSSSVINATASGLSVVVDKNGVATVSGLTAGTECTVYNILGVPVGKGKASSESITISLPAPGVYVLRAGNSEGMKFVY